MISHQRRTMEQADVLYGVSMQADGVELPSDMDVEQMRERLHELSSMEVIPIPAKIGNFTREEDILAKTIK